MTYKIGQMYIAKYVDKQSQYKVGQRAYIFENGIKVACFVVKETNELEANGKIVNTYGHKRCK